MLTAVRRRRQELTTRNCEQDTIILELCKLLSSTSTFITQSSCQMESSKHENEESMISSELSPKEARDDGL
jgi:hypothetical protein